MNFQEMGKLWYKYKMSYSTGMVGKASADSLV